ncbi:hypothetical protein EYY95_21755 [Hafnia alvei]|uniref:SIR2 family protein n=1 Tax=Hafnia alvei TaxID=569 RepID=UPI00103354A2|nr:SIR2 family protein [Hafnia alvei]TBL82187.1 hypothetical protein EYY95_21755 [Hafnia alvei]
MSTKEHFNIIRKAIDNNKLCIFVGSGVSFDSNLPSWKSLIDVLRSAIDTFRGQNDFLKIAEHYFIEYGRNAYYGKVNEFFPSNSEPNLLHKKILELKPQHIITTNWDDLLEKAVSRENEFYFPVSTDYELASSPSSKLILKMHGDLKHRNIVFKESDYLSYSDNFPLIENFVKSLFSTHVVIFIGYSITDYNLNLILSWVRNRTNDAPPAFTIFTDENISYAEKNHLTSKGVYPLLVKNQCSITENADDKLSITGRSIYNLLNEIITPKIENLMSEDFAIELISETSSWEIFHPEMLVQLIRDKLNIIEINKIYLDSEHGIIIYNLDDGELLKTRSSYRKLRTAVRELLMKVPVHAISFKIKYDIKFSIKNKNTFTFEDEYTTFNYDLVSKNLASTQLATQIDLDEIFKTAYDSYYLKKPTSARELFSSLTSSYFSKSQFVKSVMSAFNKLQCYSGEIPFEESTKIFETGISDYLSKNDNISELIEKFPNSLMRKQKSLYQGLDFNSTLYLNQFKKISKNCYNLDKDWLLNKKVNTQEMASLYHRLYWISSFTIKNKITTLYSSTYKDIALTGASTILRYVTKGTHLEFDTLLCFMILVSYTEKDIFKLLEKYLGKENSVSINDDVYNYLINVLENSINYTKKNTYTSCSRHNLEMAAKTLSILSFCNLGHEKTKNIIALLWPLFSIHDLDWYLVSAHIERYIIRQYKSYGTTFDMSQLSSMIEVLSDKLTNVNPVSDYNTGSILDAILVIMKETNNSVDATLRDSKKIERFILTIPTYPIDEQIKKINSSLFTIYSLSTGRLKASVKRIMKSVYTKIKKELHCNLSYIIYSLNMISIKVINKNELDHVFSELKTCTEEAIKNRRVGVLFLSINQQMNFLDESDKVKYASIIEDLRKLSSSLNKLHGED